MIPSIPKLLGLIAIIWVVWTVFRIYETRLAAIRANQTKDDEAGGRGDRSDLTIRLNYANANNVGRGSVGKIVGGKTALIKAGSTCFSPAFAARLRRWF